MPLVYLGLGTNLGNKEENIRRAVEEINRKIGKTISLSSFYETEPWGFSSENNFLNAAICVQTDLTPAEVLHTSQSIEKEAGRTRKTTNRVYHDRIIDIDLLLYDSLIIRTAELTLPHPLMTERPFVMIPLAEIAPETIHPVYHKKLKEFL